MSKVMLVEDDMTMLSLLTTLLEIEGFQVISALDEDPQAILQQIHQEQPDLLLMDVNLRQLNGLDMLRLLRQDAQASSVRVIMSSGMDFRHECLLAGATDFIMKPYMPDDLIDQIRQVLSRTQ